MFDTWWMHPQRKNERGVLIRQILHNAYQEAERLLRDQIEFDFAIDYRFTKKGYDEIIYILDDGKVRIERGAEQQLLDGPRSVSRPELGPRPTISRHPRRVRDPIWRSCHDHSHGGNGQQRHRSSYQPPPVGQDVMDIWSCRRRDSQRVLASRRRTRRRYDKPDSDFLDHDLAVRQNRHPRKVPRAVQYDR